MTCHELQVDLQAYLDGELSPVRRALIENHLSSCSDCRGVLAQLKTVSKALRGWTDTQPDGAFEMSLHSRLSVESAPAAKPAPKTPAVTRPAPRRSFKPALLALAARGWIPASVAAAVLLCVVGYFVANRPKPVRRVPPLARTQTLTALSSAAAAAQVADGWMCAAALSKGAMASEKLEASRVVSSDIVSGFLAMMDNDADRNIALRLINLLAGRSHLDPRTRTIDTAALVRFPFALFTRDVYAASLPADPLAVPRRLEMHGRLNEALANYRLLASADCAERAALGEGALLMRMADLDAAEIALSRAVDSDDSLVSLSARQFLAEIATARQVRLRLDPLRLAAVSAADWLKVGLLEIQTCDYRAAANSFMKSANAAGGERMALAQEARFRSAWCQKEIGQVSTAVYGFKTVCDDPNSPPPIAYAAGIEHAIALSRSGLFRDSVAACRELARRPAPDVTLEALLYFHKGCVELRDLGDVNSAAESLGIVSAAGQGNLSYAALVLLQRGSR